MQINIDLKVVARIVAMFEFVFIVCMVILCIGQSIGTDIEVLDPVTLTWVVMINQFAILWLVFRQLRQSVEKADEDRDVIHIE